MGATNSHQSTGMQFAERWLSAHSPPAAPGDDRLVDALATHAPAAAPSQ